MRGTLFLTATLFSTATIAIAATPGTPRQRRVSRGSRRTFLLDAAPLLLVHGTDDANPGTTPLQSEQLYEAIRGNGGITRLVMLPNEPHWYSSMESNEQLA